MKFLNSNQDFNNYIYSPGAVVQSWVSASLCISTCPFLSKLQKPKLLLTQTRFVKFINKVAGKYDLNFTLTQG